MISHYCISIAFILSLFSIHSFAADYMQFDADLDGDKKPETILASTSDTDSNLDEYRKFSIRIGSATYTGEYFAVDGKLPKLTVVTLDKNRSSRQLLVKMQEPISCKYHILAYSSEKIIVLLKLKVDAGCKIQLHGDGTLGVPAWEGFWFREQNYRLNPEGTTLTLMPQEVYFVGISATANNNLTLEKAQCQQSKIKQGSKLLVEKFDIALHRYLINTGYGACGWLQEKKMKDYIGGLPWSG